MDEKFTRLARVWHLGLPLAVPGPAACGARVVGESVSPDPFHLILIFLNHCSPPGYSPKWICMGRLKESPFSLIF